MENIRAKHAMQRWIVFLDNSFLERDRAEAETMVQSLREDLRMQRELQGQERQALLQNTAEDVAAARLLQHRERDEAAARLEAAEEAARLALQQEREGAASRLGAQRELLKRQRECIVVSAVERVRVRLVGRVFGVWLAHVSAQAWLKRCLFRGLAATQSMRLAAAFEQWREGTVRQQQRARAVFRVRLRVAHLAVGRAFDCWHAATMRLVWQRRCLAASAVTKFGAQLETAFVLWHLHATFLRRRAWSAGRVEAMVFRSRLALVWSQWSAEARRATAEREARALDGSRIEAHELQALRVEDSASIATLRERLQVSPSLPGLDQRTICREWLSDTIEPDPHVS
jgi:hypothetical protein